MFILYSQSINSASVCMYVVVCVCAHVCVHVSPCTCVYVPKCHLQIMDLTKACASVSLKISQIFFCCSQDLKLLKGDNQ